MRDVCEILADAFALLHDLGERCGDGGGGRVVDEVAVDAPHQLDRRLQDRASRREGFGGVGARVGIRRDERRGEGEDPQVGHGFVVAIVQTIDDPLPGLSRLGFGKVGAITSTSLWARDLECIVRLLDRKIAHPVAEEVLVLAMNGGPGIDPDLAGQAALRRASAVASDARCCGTATPARHTRSG